jgi:hypothetical protein
VLASAATKAVSPDPAESCGTSYNLIGATETGSFVIARVDATRKGPVCKGSKNVDHWQYIEVAANGSRRAIYDADAGSAVETGLPSAPLAEVEVDGDYAALVTAKSLKVYMKNLVTGSMVGPFADSVRTAGHKIGSIGVSVGPNGMLAVASNRELPGTKESPDWTDLFANPSDPVTAVRSTEPNNAQFCGPHLIGMDDDKGSNKSAIVELDLKTLAVSRRLAVVRDSDWLQSCTATEMVVSREVESLASLILRVLAIPA